MQRNIIISCSKAICFKTLFVWYLRFRPWDSNIESFIYYALSLQELFQNHFIMNGSRIKHMNIIKKEHANWNKHIHSNVMFGNYIHITGMSYNLISL